MISFRWRRAATLLAVLALTALPAAGPAYADTAAPAATVASSSHRQLPEPPPVDVARTELDELTVDAPHSMDGYSRSRFPHWAIITGTCDSRETVLARDGQDVVQDDQCRAVSGTWESPYDHKVFTDARQLDIDLTHPQLVAVSATSNRAKADKGPDQWRPPATDFWCEYARAWTNVKWYYHLNTTPPRRRRSPTCSRSARSRDPARRDRPDRRPRTRWPPPRSRGRRPSPCYRSNTAGQHWG